MKEILLLLLVSMIATQKESLASPTPGLFDDVKVGAVGRVLSDLLKNIGAKPFDASAAAAQIKVEKEAITKATDAEKAVVEKELEKLKDCQVTPVRTAFETLLGDIDTLKSVMQGDIHTFKSRTSTALEKVTSKKVENAIDGLNKDCRAKCMDIWERVSKLVKLITTKINGLIKPVGLQAKQDVPLLPLTGVLGSH